MGNAKWTVIGISGVTCGGKSSLAKQIHDVIPGSVLIIQDEYFLDRTDPRHVFVPELQHANWEIMSSLDYEKLVKDVENTIGGNCSGHEPPVLVVEGHLLFNSPALAGMIDRKYFLTLTQEQCRRRRSSRVYDPADVPGYFDMVVWPAYLQHRIQMEDTAQDILYLDGNQSQEEIYQKVVQDLKESLDLNLAA